MNVTENHYPNQVIGVISSGEYSFSHLLAFFSSHHTRPIFEERINGPLKRNKDLLKDECNSISEKKIKDLLGDAYVNSWSLFGVHDTAILIRSEGRLDEAVNKVDDWISKLNEENISIKKQICERLFPFVGDDTSIDYTKKIKESPQLRELECIAELYKSGDSDEKKFKIFEYKVDPLIPLYVGKDIKLNENSYKPTWL